ncbi:MAG TPA: SGNH/GDSL hydrolase family protein [Gemmatimonadaceae bacterium]|nr:SGNH/GDSL hydrolase family protein [Gemmatimonadaceae bacterium]
MSSDSVITANGGARSSPRRRARFHLATLLLVLAACATPGPPAPVVPPPAARPSKPLPDTARFASEINAFAHADSVNPPPSNAALFVGSSSIRFWESAATDFPGLPVINRGFGGSRMDDLLRYADRIVLPYRPRAIVLYEGDNDLQDGRNPARIAGDVAEFLALVRTRVPGTRVICLAVKPSPSRWNLVEKMRVTNALLQQIVERDTAARFIDVFTPMLGADGRPRPELFRDDSLHMTRAGYELWTRLVDPELRAAMR